MLLDRVAALNGRIPMSMVNEMSRAETQAGLRSSWPTHLGGGWYGSTRRGMTTITNGQYSLRWSANDDIVRVEIPEGARLPNGGTAAQNETCHIRGLG